MSTITERGKTVNLKVILVKFLMMETLLVLVLNLETCFT